MVLIGRSRILREFPLVPAHGTRSWEQPAPVSAAMRRSTRARITRHSPSRDLLVLTTAMDSALIFHAIQFASAAHAGQYRKNTRVPYLIYPLRVSKILVEAGCAE